MAATKTTSCRSVRALGLTLVLVLVLENFSSDHAAAAGLQLSPRRGAERARRGMKRRDGRGSWLTPPPSSSSRRPSTTKRRYRVGNEDDVVDKRGRRLTFPLRKPPRGEMVRGEEEEDGSLAEEGKGLALIDGLQNGRDDADRRAPRRMDGEKRSKYVVNNVHELRSSVLDEGVALRDIDIRVPQLSTAPSTKDEVHKSINGASKNYPFDHEVLRLISERAATKSKPGKRPPDDGARLALAIEGGGMRGAVSAGMVAAIGCLGLCDAFDTIYGSSAGSIIGAYMVSRQMCVDAFFDILPAAKDRFVKKNMLVSSLVRAIVDAVLTKTVEASRAFGLGAGAAAKEEGQVDWSPRYVGACPPGLNISFVLDGIMCPTFGLRPLDLDLFRANDAMQPLRVVASTVREGKMETACFGSRESDFFDDVDRYGMVKTFASTSADGVSHGLFACLEASMKVPAATGPPLSLIRARDSADNVTTHCFDAFCHEPLPYRSAVEEGATHVLALRTRPDGVPIKTRPAMYESIAAPMYFKSHGLGGTADFFKNGGQQYIYLEDILTLDEGKEAPSSSSPAVAGDGVLVPPPGILYGADADSVHAGKFSPDRDTWKRAHLLPVTLPRDTKELSQISQDKDEVLRAVREGFAAAFDMLAPAAGVDLSRYPHLSGRRVSELMFPKVDDGDGSTSPPFEEPSVARGHLIDDVRRGLTREKAGVRRGMLSLRRGRIRFRRRQRGPVNSVELRGGDRDGNADGLNGRTDLDRERKPPNAHGRVRSEGEGQKVACPKRDAKTLLKSLPGIQAGKLSELAEGLRYHQDR